MNFTRNSFELHMKIMWTSYEFHMNKFDFISYEIHMKFIWSTYEVPNNFLRRSHKFHVKLCIYGFIRTSYEWASRSIVIQSSNDLLFIEILGIYFCEQKILIALPRMCWKWNLSRKALLFFNWYFPAQAFSFVCVCMPMSVFFLRVYHIHATYRYIFDTKCLGWFFLSDIRDKVLRPEAPFTNMV